MKQEYTIAEYIIPKSAAEILEELKQQYPAYYKAWRSMVANRSVDEITDTWRGMSGLRQFIADTSELKDNPDECPGVKLKRKRLDCVYSMLNVYWKLPKNTPPVPVSDTATSDTATPATSANLDAIASRIKLQYPTAEQQEVRFNELGCKFNQSRGEQIELDILSALLYNTEITPEVKLSKFEDI